MCNTCGCSFVSDLKYIHDYRKCEGWCKSYSYTIMCGECFDKEFDIQYISTLYPHPTKHRLLRVTKKLPQNTKTKSARNQFIDSEQQSQT